MKEYGFILVCLGIFILFLSGLIFLDYERPAKILCWSGAILFFAGLILQHL